MGCGLLLAFIVGFVTRGLAADIRARDHGRLVMGYVVRVKTVGRIGTGFGYYGYQEIHRLQWCDLETHQVHWTRCFRERDHTGYRQDDGIRAYKLGPHFVWEGDVGAPAMDPSSIPTVRRN